MKRILLFLMMLTINIVGFAQSDETEKASPMTETEIVRKCAILDVEGKQYENGTVTIKSKSPDYFLTDKFKVKVTVTDESGNVEEKILPYMEETELGNYFKAVHYADSAIGDFINDLDENGLLENTVVVIYGDHDAKISKKEYRYFYNYVPKCKYHLIYK